MDLSRPLRLPLASGRSALNLATGVMVVGAAAAVPLYFLTLLPDWAALPCGLLAGVWGLAALCLPLGMWSRRAGDLVLDARGVRVVSGPHRGLEIAWSEIDPARCGLVRRSRHVGWDGFEWALVLNGRELGGADEVDGARGLAAIAAIVRAIGFERAGSAPVAPHRVAVCSACGALPGVEGEGAACRACAGPSVPAPVRRRLAAEAALRALRDEARAPLGRRLSVPGARMFNALFALSVPLLVLVWPVAGCWFDEFYQARRVYAWHDGLFLAGASLALSAGAVLLVEARAAGREVACSLAASFHAIAPASARSPHRCRRCRARLACDAGAILVECRRCLADNLLAPERAPAPRDLEAVLRAVRRARRGQSARAALGIALLAAGVKLAAIAVHAAYPG